MRGSYLRKEAYLLQAVPARKNVIDNYMYRKACFQTAQGICKRDFSNCTRHMQERFSNCPRHMRARLFELRKLGASEALTNGEKEALLHAIKKGGETLRRVTI